MKTTYMTTRLLVLLIAGSVTGCTTMLDVILEKNAGGGTVQMYPVSQEQAWDISKSVFHSECGNPIEEHRDQGYMLTSGTANGLTAGTVMGAWLEPAGAGQTRVTVITRRRAKIDPVTSLTESTYHKRFAEAVELLKAGKTPQ
jgi:hypothetical protein